MVNSLLLRKVFSTRISKVYKTQEDIKQDTDGDLKDKLSLALNLLLS